MKPKTKKLVLGTGVAIGGLYVLAKLPQTKDTPLGAAGGIVARPMDSLLSTSTDQPAPPPSETMASLLESLPFYPMAEGGWGASPPSIPLIGRDEDAPVTISKKASSIVSSASLIPKIGAYAIMKPVQILGGGIGAPIGAGIAHIVGRTPTRQAEAVRRYPETSHAISMLTGGATIRAPVTKKQEAAREKYPTTYKIWKSAFSWLGA
jgi:hypothetical protein